MSYEVFPSKRIQISLYDHSTSAGSRYSGMFTAYFTCHDPFGQLIHVWDDGSCSETEYTMTGILPTELMPPAPASGSLSFLLYNPGYEEAHTLFRLSGDVGEDGLLIRNFTTGQRCRVVGLKKTSLLPEACLVLDSRLGQTYTSLGDEKALAFPFHDEGYITLAPCTPFVRSLFVGHTQGSNAVTSTGGFLPHMKGQYLYLDGWFKIQQVTDANNAIVSGMVASSGNASTPVVTMNEIELSGEVQLSSLDVQIFPRMR